MSRRMLSISSAPGWSARVAAEGHDTRPVTLVSWALVEEADGTTAIVGVVQRSADDGSPAGRLGLADEVPGFQGYTFTGLTTKPGSSS